MSTKLDVNFTDIVQQVYLNLLGESCLIESPDRWYEAASPHLRREGLSRFILFLDTHSWEPSTLGLVFSVTRFYSLVLW